MPTPIGFSPTSSVLNYAFCVSATALLALFCLAHFLYEPILMPRFYKKIYRDLSPENRRSFTCHHIWLTAKLLCIPAVWPIINIFPRQKLTTDPLYSGTSVTNGDFLAVFYILIVSMFMFELIYRTKVSPVSMGHHIGGVILAIWQIAEDIQSATGDSTPLDAKATASQFRLIMAYGTYEVAFETYPHFAVILHRLNKGRDMALSRIWTIAGIFSITGSLGEFVTIAVFMWKNWYLWDTPMKVIQPILHFCFMAAQLHGARIGFRLGFDYRQKAVKAGLVKGNPNKRVPWILRLPFENKIYRNPQDKKTKIPPQIAASDVEKHSAALDEQRPDVVHPVLMVNDGNRPTPQRGDTTATDATGYLGGADTKREE